MKYALLLICTLSLSGQVFGFTAVDKAAAPSSDVSLASSRVSGQEVYHDYDNSDTIQTGQSSTKREYNYDAKVKSCRNMDGSWLRYGEVGYASCMDDTKTLKR